MYQESPGIRINHTKYRKIHLNPAPAGNLLWDKLWILVYPASCFAIPAAPLKMKQAIKVTMTFIVQGERKAKKTPNQNPKKPQPKTCMERFNQNNIL